jgi:hypothetical protein
VLGAGLKFEGVTAYPADTKSCSSPAGYELKTDGGELWLCGQDVIQIPTSTANYLAGFDAAP